MDGEARITEPLTDASGMAVLYEALANAQGEMENATKDVENTFFKSKYSDLASVRTAIREPFAKNGLAVIQLPRYDSDTGLVTVRTILTHKSGVTLEDEEPLSLPVGKKDAQAVGSAITYARRYALMAIAGIAPEDDDGNAAVFDGATGSFSQKQNSNENKLPKSKARDLYAELQQDIDACGDKAMLESFASQRKADIDRLPADWQEDIRNRYKSALIEFKNQSGETS